LLSLANRGPIASPGAGLLQSDCRRTADGEIDEVDGASQGIEVP
jgi:hypothetical protein